jgi:hypothetical protein
MKYYGAVGYITTVETRPGVWEETIVERMYSGDVSSIRRRLDGKKVNDDVNISNQISIVADPYAFENFTAIRYVVWLNQKLKVTNITVEPPRMIFEVGGLYNE